MGVSHPTNATAAATAAANVDVLLMPQYAPKFGIPQLELIPQNSNIFPVPLSNRLESTGVRLQAFRASRKQFTKGQKRYSVPFEILEIQSKTNL
jgi:hypothetical protein